MALFSLSEINEDVLFLQIIAAASKSESSDIYKN